MSTFNTIDEARAYFEGDRFAVENGVTLDALGENWATCSMPIRYSPWPTSPEPWPPTTCTTPPSPSR